jgi:MFS family permease
MLGTIYFGFMVSLIASTGLFHPYSLGMASGVGAGIMMASATATLVEIFPKFAKEISALAATSETLSGVTGIYVALFIGLPFCNFLYRHLEPRFARLRGETAVKEDK